MIYKKQMVDQDVLTLARRRISDTYDRYDHVAVSFSGGKDSTVCLNLALEEARKRGRLPLDVIHWDEEAISPETVDYVRRVYNEPDVKLRWLCLPVQHRNACSKRHPYWYPWDPDKEELWTRPLPPEATTLKDMPNYRKGIPIPKSNEFLWPHENGRQVAVILGIRADESLSRYRGVASKKGEDNYIAPSPNWKGEDRESHSKYITLIKPIYDWTTDDVWVAPHALGWDYNRAYDTMATAGIGKHEQRVAPPYGEEPLKGLWMYGVCWPELWGKMTQRVPGAATAGRYARTELYSFGSHVDRPPEGMSWQDFLKVQLNKFNPKERQMVAARIKREITSHNRKTNNEPLKDTDSHPLTGLSWQFLAMIAIRGDFKNRKIAASPTQRSKGNPTKKKGGTSGEETSIEAEQGSTRY